ncbi:MAG: pyruvate, phosphate dikinase [Actinobacteria bacterium]|nr:pyruvate, phosphate dikinase [Actinomycetota bacterium]
MLELPVAFVYAFDHVHGLPFDEVTGIVGGKGANLGLMTVELGLPVPPGFTISTEACRAYLEGGWPEGLDEEIRRDMAGVEAAMGRRFGDPGNPLLVSVRSGAPVSMPGMMDTILNLGLDDETERGLAGASGDAFAAACRTRLEVTYRDIVGVDEVPADPWRQLRGAIEAVFRSWNGDRARAYRAHEGIPEDLGTAVNVQAMVFGNLGEDSGTGVIFTRNPATGEAVLYGDVLFNAQGEDVVAGTHATEPITVLDERMPEIAAELRGYADTLERHYADVCDIEFTIERRKLWLLQNRIGKRSPQAALRCAVEMAEDPGFPLSRAEAVARVADLLADPPRATVGRAAAAPVIATGLAASPGVAAGEIVTSADDAVEAAGAGRTVVLVRTETSPDDVHGMESAVAILTSRGGLASHAAVVARGWGIPAVVGAADVEVGTDSITIGNRCYSVGYTLTVDGSQGTVYEGDVAGESEIVPEAAVLLGWALELGIDVGGSESGGATMADTDAEGAGIPLRELAIRALLIKGYANPEGFAPVILSSEDTTAALLGGLLADGLVEPMGPMYKLSADGSLVGEAMLADDTATWGLEAAGAALDAFIPFDQRMKHIVTAWQMHEVDGVPVMNDHADAAYDDAVLGDFAALHGEAGPWVGSLVAGLARMEVYRVRLSRAAANVAAGHHAFIASPRVDSYHNAWFELHEDLIRLAGKTREEETAAGRA